MELSPGLDFAFNAATLDREAVLQALMDNKEPWWPKDSADDNASGGEPQESSLTSCSTEPEEEDKVMDSHAGRYVMEAMDEDICRAQKMAADSTQAMEAETTQLPADGPVFLARAQDCGKLHRVVLPSCNLPEPPQQKQVPEPSQWSEPPLHQTKPSEPQCTPPPGPPPLRQGPPPWVLAWTILERSLHPPQSLPWNASLAVPSPSPYCG